MFRPFQAFVSCASSPSAHGGLGLKETIITEEDAVTPKRVGAITVLPRLKRPSLLVRPSKYYEPHIQE